MRQTVLHTLVPRMTKCLRRVRNSSFFLNRETPQRPLLTTTEYHNVNDTVFAPLMACNRPNSRHEDMQSFRQSSMTPYNPPVSRL